MILDKLFHIQVRTLILSILLVLSSFSGFPQEITLVTTGEGETKREAVTDALRSAIEQSYTTFVSANTTILDDKVVKDDAVTITSGNIKSYKELSCVKTPGGFYEATVSATVSIGKLIEFAKSHGSSAEFAGNTFAMNMKMKELNKKNEKEALNNLITSLNNYARDLFTGKIRVNNPRNQGGKIIVPIELTVTTTENFLTFKDYLFETLTALSLSPQEVEEYNQNNEPYVMISKKFYPYQHSLHIIKEPKDAFFYLRGDREEIRNFMEQLSQILDRSFRNVMVREKGGTDKTASVPQSELSFSVIFNRDGYFEEDKNKGGNITKPYFSVGPRVPMVVAGEKVAGKFQPVDLSFEKNHVVYKGEVNIPYNSSDEISKVSGYEVFTPVDKTNNPIRNNPSQANTSNKKTQSRVGSSNKNLSKKEIIQGLTDYGKEYDIPLKIEGEIVKFPLEGNKTIVIDLNQETITTPEFTGKIHLAETSFTSLGFSFFVEYNVDGKKNYTLVSGFPILISVQQKRDDNIKYFYPGKTPADTGESKNSGMDKKGNASKRREDYKNKNQQR